MLFSEVIKYSRKIAATSSKNEKVNLIVEFLSKLKISEAEIGTDLISSNLPISPQFNCFFLA
ncbi:hypothetical protein KAX35_00310 [candidate division WOR-3 bacterium]|nr:hypothetical protein [candidate division WOR-3 bacterium]